MAIEKCYSLTSAAKIASVGRETLRRWLEIELGVEFPNITRGSKYLLMGRCACACGNTPIKTSMEPSLLAGRMTAEACANA